VHAISCQECGRFSSASCQLAAELLKFRNGLSVLESHRCHRNAMLNRDPADMVSLPWELTSRAHVPYRHACDALRCGGSVVSGGDVGAAIAHLGALA
jgi:hypothetical protein